MYRSKLEFPVVGSNYLPGALALISGSSVGEILELKPDPDNSYDPLAIKVLYKNTHIGFVPNKGRTCSNCWSAVASTDDYCAACDAGYDSIQEGGLAFRIHKQGILKRQYSCVIDTLDLSSKYSQVRVLMIIE